MAEFPAKPQFELILHASVGKLPVELHGSWADGKLDSLSGYLAVKRSLRETLAGLGKQFEGATGPLCEFLGTAADSVEIGGLGVSYRNQALPAVQIAALIAISGSELRLFSVKRLKAGDDEGGFVAGVELTGNGNKLENNFLSGLIGDIALENLSVFYANAAVEGLVLDRTEPGPIGLVELPQSSETAGRDFKQGINLSARLLLGGVDLLDSSDQISPPAPASSEDQRAASGSSDSSPLAKTSTFWFDVDKSVGPVKIKRVGLSYEAAKVGISMDGGLTLAGLSLTLEGLGLDCPLSELSRGPKAIWQHLGFRLDGASVSLDAGAIGITGGLLRVSKDPLQLDGTLQVRTLTLTISAVGSYADINGEPSFFAFAALHQELGGPAFFFVTGLCFGLGINRRLTLPPIDKVHEFPLLKAAKDPAYLGAKLDLRKISGAINAYIEPAVGCMWIAAGVKFMSFGMIDSVAIISVAFGTRVEIGLLGLSTLQLPKPLPGEAKPPAPLAYVELAIKVAIAPEQGLLSVEGRLTENSYVLRSDFKLRGGFAFCCWFAGPHQGDFVVSLGGYHRAFKRPSHYPVPERVEFNCKLGNVTIKGQCYFALCPVAVMAGGQLSIVYHSGGIQAWMIACADFLLQWKPLYYDIAISLTIGAALNLDMGLFRLRLSVELSAALRLFGPPLAGAITVDLHVVSFTVRFGPSKKSPPLLRWEAVDADGSFAKCFLANPDVTRTSIVDGLLEQIDLDEQPGGPLQIRVVDPHRLHLRCRTSVPATAVTFNGTTDLDGKSITPQSWVKKAVPQLGVRPMGKSSFYSRIDITLEPLGDDSRETHEFLNQYLEITATTENVPVALWGNKKLPGSIPPDDVLVEDALVGLEIKTRPGPRPWETKVLDLEVLAHDRFTRRYRGWENVRDSSKLPGDDVKAIGETIMAPNVAARRTAIVNLLNQRAGEILDPAQIQLDYMAAGASCIFQVMPAMARVGQVPPTDFREV